MTFRTIETGKPVMLLSLLATALAQAALAQSGPARMMILADVDADAAQAQAAPATQTPAPPPQVPTTQIAASPAPPAVPLAKPMPDYPDPRTLTIGAFYFATQEYRGGDIASGHQATAVNYLYDLGKGKGVPGVEVSYPITRTGTIYAEYWIAKYDGNQTLGYQTNPFAQTYFKGTLIATTEKVEHGRLYLDDLLWPHSFPVPRFRLKSLWAVEYTKVSATVDTPGVQAATSSTGVVYGGPIGGSHSVILPELGIAAEYAVTPHVLGRVAVMGFGLPHHSDTWEADASLSVRHKSAEVVFGGKMLHYKTTSQSSEFFVGNVVGAFAELRWHPSLF